MKQNIVYKRENEPPDDIIVLAIRAINGEITSSMRQISFGYNGRDVVFRFYMERDPTEIEKENAEVIAVNFDAGHPHKLNNLDIQFYVTSDYFRKLDPLNFILYRRYED